VAVTEPTPREALPPGPVLRLVRDQRVAFLIVGCFNTANGFALFVLFHLILGNGFVRYMTTLLLAHVFAVTCAFFLHRRFVFRVRGHLLLDAVRFEAVNLGALGLNAALLPFFVEVAGFGVVLAQLFAGGAVVVLSYLGHSLFSFRRPRHVSRSAPAAEETR
jgi:putative flippase GtrA